MYIRITYSYVVGMNILLKHRYFRRECFYRTWTPSLAYKGNAKWYFDYSKSIEDIDIIVSCCMNGYLDLLRKVPKSILHTKVKLYLSMYKDEMYIAYYNVGCRKDYFVSYYKDKINGCVSSWSENRVPNPYRLTYIAYHTKKYVFVDVFTIICGSFGHLDGLRYFIGHGGDIHIHNNELLRQCCINGHLHIVQYLVENGVSLNDEHNNILGSAVYGQNMDIIRYLIEHGCHVNGYKPLQESILANNFAIFTYLFSKMPLLLKLNISEMGVRLLPLCVKCKSWDIYNFMVAHGANQTHLNYWQRIKVIIHRCFYSS